jgi:hypothetical protein
MRRALIGLSVLALALVSVPIPALSISGTFTDDDGSVHEPDIQAIAEVGLTNGCGPGLYCPADVVTREQMASFLVRALGLQPLASGPFVDLLPNVHVGDINALAAAGITLGCDTDRFCPTDPVRRDQMASFLTRAFDLAPAPSAGFTDVPAQNPHAADIDAIAAASITVGCGGSSYCPSDAVRRDQMASFLRRGLDLEPSYVRLPLFEGMPLGCTKDGLVCTGSISLPYRPTYRLSEGFYQVLPASEAETAALLSPATDVRVVIDGIEVVMSEGATVVGTDRQTVTFEQAVTISPGVHTVEALWLLDGNLVQTVRLTLSVG